VAFPDWSAVTSPVVRTALLAMVGTDHVLHRWSGYSTTLDQVRAALLRLYADNGKAPTHAELAAGTSLSEGVLRPLLDELRRRDLAVLEDGRIVGAYPFSDRDTGHHVEIDGRTVNAMCAVDALGVGAMLDRDVQIRSRCRHCGEPVSASTRDQGRALRDVKPKKAVVWLSVQYEGGCAANSLCSATAFFCSDDHLAAWRSGRPADEPGLRLLIAEALEAGRAIFGPSLVGLLKDPPEAALHRGATLPEARRRTPLLPGTWAELGTDTTSP
jgi:hypothetical protein